jgi:hypothetical protein
VPDKLEQSSGSDAVNLQAARDINVSAGVTPADVIAIANETFRNNVLQFREETRALIEQRARDLSELVLLRLERDAPGAARAFSDPDMEYAMYNAQVAYARSGDAQLLDLLAKLVVERATTVVDVARIVLTESLRVAPLLTTTHLNILSVLLLTRQFSRNHATLDQFGLDLRHVVALVVGLDCGDNCFRHLQYAGCVLMHGATGIPPFYFEKSLLDSYGGLLQRPWTPTEIETLSAATGLTDADFVENWLEPGTRSLRYQNVKDIQSLEFRGVDRPRIATMISAQQQHWLPINEIAPRLETLALGITQAARIWSGSALAMFGLTSVGIALGLANLNRLYQEPLDLSRLV